MRIVTTSMLLGLALARLAHIVAADRLARAVRSVGRLTVRTSRATQPSHPGKRGVPNTLPVPIEECRPCP